ncbi:MAG: hypothetical protein JJT81_12930 [Rubellimicrobium sp.]|nr:hypothetical protein [Rubellimicrobium sp.]
MLISLHKQATTTPKIRAAIQASTEPAWMVAERYGISEQTVWKWRNREDVHDRSHTPHKLQTTLTPPQGSSVRRSIQWFMPWRHAQPSSLAA